MAIKMLLYDFRDSEKDFFKNNKLENFDITFFPESINEKTVKDLSNEDKEKTIVLSTFITSDVTKAVIDEFKNLRVIATRSTGYNHIDLKACNERNIAVVNVENYGSTTVVQFCWGLIITLIRKIIPAEKDMQKLAVNHSQYAGRDLTQMTLGVVGTGAIGSEMCKIAHCFNMKEILATDCIKNKYLEKEYNVKYVDCEELLEKSDVITLHTPLSNKNYHMISENQFKLMKNKAYLINTSRGELVNTDALYKALREKNIGGAALDVFECEDISFHSDNLLEDTTGKSADCLTKTLLIQKLSEMDNVIITPHIAYDTKDSVEKILQITFENIKDNWQGGGKNQVN